jgi:eukaryotic-like serine/threonine-protein kinase
MVSTTLHLHYQIIQVLDIGRSGITYLAKDLDLIDSPYYVVKEIQGDSNSRLIPAMGEQLFEIQESIAYRVGQHPQIPSLVGKFVENGHQYLVREYIEGELLSQELITSSQWSQTQVFDFLIDLVGILCFVHSFKYIHQSINPYNIIRRNEDGRYNLLGFSSIEDIANPRHSNHQLSLNHSIYIPYEQAQNVPQFNSDIYAVGVIAIQALVGKSPLDRDPDSYEFKWKDDVKIDHKLIKIIVSIHI